MGREFLKVVGNADSHSHGNGGCAVSSDGHGSAVGKGALAAINPLVMAEAGFSGNVALVTLGCAKNQVDSEVMLGTLTSRGFRPIGDPEQADLIVVNTCGFLRSAVEEGIDTILNLSKYRQDGRCRRLVVAGCMVERYRDELKVALPEVDRFLSTDELLNVADEADTTAECLVAARRPYFLYDETMPRVRSTAGHYAFVKVAEGCDRPCTFCIIPKIRGAFRSRSIDSIVAEVTQLLSEGVREINLVAQDLTAFGCDRSPKRLGTGSSSRSELLQLLKRLEVGARDFFGANLGTAEPRFWSRLLYAYPVGIDEELIEQIAASPIVCKYLDLPLQHISARVLKAMQRPLGERGTRGLIEQIRRIAPQIALRTTFIVGFPGETDEDVASLEAFINEGHFSHVGIFTYSREPGTPAHDLDEQVPTRVAEARRKRLMKAQQRVVSARLSTFVGQIIPVLVDGYHTESEMLLSGRAEWQAPETDGEVIINDIAEEYCDEVGDYKFEQFTGKFVNVEVTGVAGYDLVGKISSAASLA